MLDRDQSRFNRSPTEITVESFYISAPVRYGVSFAMHLHIALADRLHETGQHCNQYAQHL